MYLRIRNLCGLLGVILPWLALFSAGIAERHNSEWWWSISHLAQAMLRDQSLSKFCQVYSVVL